jgi:hypothetical protein
MKLSPKPTLSKLSLVLLITLSNLGCKTLPEKPDLIWWGVYNDADDPGFYSVDPSRQIVFRGLNDPAMKGSQCLEPRDLIDLETYITEIKRRVLISEP